MNVESIVETTREQVLAVKDRDGIPGVAVSLLAGGEPVWTECFGAIDLAGGRPIDPHTIFSLQSISKNFTATAVMLAVQSRLLDLDAPITAYLPKFTVRSRFESDPQRKMTLRLLLSHRAGFTHEAPLGGNFDPDLVTAAPNFEAHVDSISDTWLRFPVGQRFAYSNLGVDLAGAILSKVCRVTFAECLRQLIFEPLGMSDSTVDAANYGARANRAMGHQPDFAAVPVRIPIEASGGVYSSIADMGRYARFHLGRGRFEGHQILDPALWETMHAPSADSPPYALGVLRLPLRLERANPILHNHDGGGYGFGATFTYCPEHDLAWIALFNGQVRQGPFLPFDELALVPTLEARFGPRVTKPTRSRLADAPPLESVEPYVGSYVASQIVLQLEREGEVFGLRVPGDEALNRFTFTGPDSSRVTDGARAPYSLRFHPPLSGQPAWLQFDIEDFASWLAFLGVTAVDFNGRDDDPLDALEGDYERFLGDYRVIQWGTPVMTLSLSKAHGRLSLGQIRLSEHAPGLLFSGDGEALDLTRDPPTYRNIPLQKVGA